MTLCDCGRGAGCRQAAVGPVAEHDGHEIAASQKHQELFDCYSLGNASFQVRDSLRIQHEPKHGRPQAAVPFRLQSVVLRCRQDGTVVQCPQCLQCWPPHLRLLQVSLPSEDKRLPNVFEFGTSYKDILSKLEERGLDKYAAAAKP